MDIGISIYNYSHNKLAALYYIENNFWRHKMEESEFEFILKDTEAKMKSVMSKHNIIRVAYSGGSDSDTVMHLLLKNGYNVKGVLYDTGIEYQATKDHVEWMRSQGYDIDVVKAVRPVPTSNKQYGHPFISKRVSDYLSRLQRHGFDFQSDGHLDFETLYKKYPRAKVALKWWCNEWGGDKFSRFDIKYNKGLKDFLIEYGLPFKVSDKCCEGAKKLPIKVYSKEHNVDLMILGIRKSEGGARAGAYKACYLPEKKYTYSMYMPLFFWNNEMKEWYDNKYDVHHSDCYSVYGLKRTGCAACPFGQNFLEEMDLLEQFEPRLAKGINNIFSPTYKWTVKYREFVAENM